MMTFQPPSLKNTLVEEYPENSEEDNPSTLNKHKDELAQYPTRITFPSPSELAILSCPPSPRSRSRPKTKEWPNLIQFFDISPTAPSASVSAKTQKKTRKGNWSPKVILGQNKNQNHSKEQIRRNDDRRGRQPHPRQRYTATFSSNYDNNCSKISSRSYDANDDNDDDKSSHKNTEIANADCSSGKSMDVRTDRQFKLESSQMHELESDNFQTAPNEGSKSSANTDEDVSDFLRMELLANVLTRISQPNKNESNSNPVDVQETNAVLCTKNPSLQTGAVVENKKRNRDRFNRCRKCLKYEKLLKNAETRIKHYENLKVFCNKEMEILREDLSKAKVKIAEQSTMLEGPTWIPITEKNVEKEKITQFSSAWNPKVDYFACRTFDTEMDAHVQLGFPDKVYSAEVHTSKRSQRHRQKIEEIRKKFKDKQNNGDDARVKVKEEENLIGFNGSDEFMSINKPIRKFRICSGTIGIRSRSTPSDPSKRYSLKKKTYLEIHQRRINRNNPHDIPNQLTIQQNNPKSSESMRKRTRSLPRNSKVSISASSRNRNSNSSNVEILAIAVASREGLIREIAHSIAKAKRILHFRFDMLIASDFRMEDFHFLLTSHRRFIRWLHNYVNYSRSLMRQFDKKHLKPGTATKLFVPAVIRLDQNETYKGIFIPIPQTRFKNNGLSELKNDDAKMYLEKPLKDSSTQETQTVPTPSLTTTKMSLAIQSSPKTVDFQQNFNSDLTLKSVDEKLSTLFQSVENFDADVDVHPNEEINNEFSFTSTRNLMTKAPQNSECGHENYNGNLIGKSQNQNDNNNNSNIICAIANSTVDSLRCAINDMDSTETFRNVLLTLPKNRNVALQSIENSTVVGAANFNYIQLSSCSKNFPVSTPTYNNDKEFSSDLNLNQDKFQCQPEIDNQLLNDTKSSLNIDVKEDNFEETAVQEKMSSIKMANNQDQKMSVQPFEEKFRNETSLHGVNQFNDIDDENNNYKSCYYDPVITEDHNHGRIKNINQTILNFLQLTEKGEKFGKVEKIEYVNNDDDENDNDDINDDEVSPPHSPCYQPIMSNSNSAQNFILKNNDNDFLTLARSNIKKNKDTENFLISPSVSNESFTPLDLIQKEHFNTAQKFYCHRGNFHMRTLDPNNLIPSNNNQEEKQEDKTLTTQHHQEQQQQQKQHLIQHFILKATSLNEPRILSPPVLLQLSRSGERKSVLGFNQMEKYFEDNVKKYKETLITEKIQNKSHLYKFPSAVQFVQGILNESKETKMKKQEQKKEKEQEKHKYVDGKQQSSELSLGNYKGGSVYTPEMEKEEEKKQDKLVEEKEKTIKSGKSKLNFMRPSIFTSQSPSSSMSINSKKKEHGTSLTKSIPLPQPNLKNKQVVPSVVLKSKPSFVFSNWKNRKTSQEQVESKIIEGIVTSKISNDTNVQKNHIDPQKQSGGEKKAKSFIQNSNDLQITPRTIQSRLPVPISPIIIQVKPSTTPGISEIQVPKALKCNSINTNLLVDIKHVEKKEKEKEDDKKEKPKRPSYIPVKTKINSNTINDVKKPDVLANTSRPKILPQTSLKRRERSLIPITTISPTSRSKTNEGVKNGRDKMEKSLSFSNPIQSRALHSNSFSQSLIIDHKEQRSPEILSENKRAKSPKKMWSKAMERTRLWSFTKKPNANKN